MGLHRSTTAALVLEGAGACNDEPEPPPITWEGEHVRFGTDADESLLCSGTLPYLDGAVGYLGEVFGHPGARVDYYWLPEGTEPHCVEHADGCADERRVFTRHAIHQHELVHAVREPNDFYLLSRRAWPRPSGTTGTGSRCKATSASCSRIRMGMATSLARDMGWQRTSSRTSEPTTVYRP